MHRVIRRGCRLRLAARHVCLAALFVASTGVAPAAAQSDASVSQKPSLPVAIQGRLERDTFTIGKLTIPAWKVEITYTNTSAQPWELGETLMFIAPSSVAGSVGLYVLREPADSAKLPKRVGDRYRMRWGINVPVTGAAVWPFIELSDIDPLDAALYSVLSGRVAALPGGGFGPPLQPGESRTIAEKIPLPFNAEIKGLRDAIVIVPPAIRTTGGGPRPGPSYLVFDVRGVVQPGAAFQPRSTEVLPDDGAALRAIADDGTQPQWRRLLALNAFVERSPAAARDLLFALADDSTPASMAAPAMLNLGVWRVPGALPVLQKLLDTRTGTLRLAAIVALGDYGDASAAPAIRALLVDKDDDTAGFATRAVGTLKDTAAIPVLVANLNGSRRSLYRASGAALVAIDTPESREALLGIVRNRRSPKVSRESVVLSLSAARAPWATDAVIAIALDEREDEDVRIAAVERLRNGTLDGAEEALQKATTSQKRRVRQAATSALEARKKAAASGK